LRRPRLNAESLASEAQPRSDSMRLRTRHIPPGARYLLAIVLLELCSARADESDVAYGPPASPLSWKVIDPRLTCDWSRFRVQHDYLGSPSKPAALVLAALDDERPYGTSSPTKVWLARFDSVLIQAQGKATRSISISLAFDASSHDLVCAFTDPSPVWAQGAKGRLIESKFAEAGRVTSPAHYKSLKSSVVAVLTEAWQNWGLDPTEQGQVVLRPRFAEFKYSQEPACNVWIVEALGKYIMTRYGPPSLGHDSTSAKQRGFVLTTKVDAYRDQDLKFVGGLIYF
jgi:hypothetical protein